MRGSESLCHYTLLFFLFYRNILCIFAVESKRYGCAISLNKLD